VRKIIEITNEIVLTAFFYALFRFIQSEYLSNSQYNEFISIFYIPAAIRVFSSLLFGYWAAAGIALGLFVDIVYMHPEQFMMSEIIFRMLQVAISLMLSLLIWAKLSTKVTFISNPVIDFEHINAFDILQICLIEAIFNSLTAHIFYIWSPTVHLDFDLYYFAVMLFGDVTGSFLLFVVANVIFSVLKLIPAFARKDHDNSTNNQ
jgi:hypothetical protein